MNEVVAFFATTSTPAVIGKNITFRQHISFDFLPIKCYNNSNGGGNFEVSFCCRYS